MLPFFILLICKLFNDNLGWMTTTDKKYEKIKKIVENKGFVLISDKGDIFFPKLKINCKLHGNFECSFKQFKIGHGCQKCAKASTVQKISISIDAIKEKVDKVGLIYIDYDEKNKILYTECKIHGLSQKKMRSKSANVRGCYECGRKSMANKRKTNIEDIRMAAETQGLKLISSSFKNQKDKIYLECAIHGVIHKNVQTTLNGYGCIKCAQNNRGQKRRRSLEDIHKLVISCGYFPNFIKYKNTKEKVSVTCKDHGPFMGTLGSLQRGHGCPHCGKTVSKAEMEIYEFVEKHCSDPIKGNRTLIKPFELDIYIPSLNLAIEYCGLRWHSEEFKKNKEYHLNKMLKCKEKGIRLITIFEDEWLERQDQVKNFLLSVLGKNEINVYARKTEIKEVYKKEASLFLKESHIQGSTSFMVAFGLYYENELIGIITGNKHHRQGFNSIFVLNRLAFKHNVSIVGGSSKLLKTLINYAKSNGYSKIISWSDNRWSEGNVYEKLGFTLTEELKPDYSYVLKQKRVSKQSCQKKHLIAKGATGTTEAEMALSLGYSRIWDCGKKRWEIPLN